MGSGGEGASLRNKWAKQKLGSSGIGLKANLSTIHVRVLPEPESSPLSHDPAQPQTPPCD